MAVGRNCEGSALHTLHQDGGFGVTILTPVFCSIDTHGPMHRTDSIDLALVISGECDMAYPGEDGQLEEIHLKPGDFIVQNGAFHEWRNRSGAHCVIYIVLFGAERKAT